MSALEAYRYASLFAAMGHALAGSYALWAGWSLREPGRGRPGVVLGASFALVLWSAAASYYWDYDATWLHGAAVGRGVARRRVVAVACGWAALLAVPAAVHWATRGR